MSAATTDNHGSFMPDRLTTILTEVCARAGLDPTGAKLIKFTNNAVFRLVCDPVVIRIAGSGAVRARVPKVVAVARWLAAHEMPSVRLLEGVEQPVRAAATSPPAGRRYGQPDDRPPATTWPTSCASFTPFRRRTSACPSGGQSVPIGSMTRPAACASTRAKDTSSPSVAVAKSEHVVVAERARQGAPSASTYSQGRSTAAAPCSVARSRPGPDRGRARAGRQACTAVPPPSMPPVARLHALSRCARCRASPDARSARSGPPRFSRRFGTVADRAAVGRTRSFAMSWIP